MRKWLADPDFVARDLLTTLERDSSFGSSTLISGGHVIIVDVYCVEARATRAKLNGTELG